MSQKTNAEAPNYRTHNISIVVLLIVIIVLLARSCNTGSSPVARESSSKPDNIEGLACTPNCPTQEDGRTVTVSLSDESSGVTPYLLPVTSGNQSNFESLPKDGFQCLISTLGNLVFYDDSGSLVKSFASPVTLQFNYTDADVEKLGGCEAGPNETDLVPVYLYLPDADTSVNIWKPFQNYSIDGRTVTIEFQFWGDPPIGWGSPR